MSQPHLHETRNGMGNWAELSSDILGVIVDQFSAIEDISHFGDVCRSWRSVSIDKWHFSIVDPWLMLAEKEDDDNRGFYSLSTKKVYNLNLPETHGRKCWSSYGWLITLGLDLEIYLLNPFSRSRVSIRLPHQSTLPNQYNPGVEREYIRRVFIRKVVLSSRPSKRTTHCEDEGKCLVMGIFSQWRKLAFLRLGDEVWTPVYTPKGTGINDVVYLNGQFYAIADGGKLVIVDISCPDPKTIEISEPPEDYDICAMSYLVESEGELFLLARILYLGYVQPPKGKKQFVRETDGFNVYKFNFDDKKWTKVKSLDNRAFFVGTNASFAIFPTNHSGCESNCIYYTDDDTYSLMTDSSIKGGAGKDMGVFRMETEELDDHYDGPNIRTYICAPFWICPSP
ncbi:putative F-box protein At5g55150 [Macadamia integrifolia]|uniref:putative F-box protein At5g55150 n=1 Tax=Macadamia integrifolia TaxID=60698 RepID=UPI001C4F8433|nr:putative F-box protein At5g55150 [Macadamia integrifolia]XP_042503589.1 putative F-box protein At5g55150 [Macadamia integrifolia]